jgi:hypothetical protein
MGRLMSEPALMCFSNLKQSEVGELRLGNAIQANEIYGTHSPAKSSGYTNRRPFLPNSRAQAIQRRRYCEGKGARVPRRWHLQTGSDTTPNKSWFRLEPPIQLP